MEDMEPKDTKNKPAVQILVDIKHDLHNLRAALKSGNIQDVIDGLNYEEGRIDALIVITNE